jgi:hypothetical protein
MGVVGGLWIAASLTIDAVPAAAAQAAGPASLSWAKLPPRGTAVHATAGHASAGPKHPGTNRAVRARPATSSPKSAAKPAAAKPAAKAAGKSPAKPAAKPTAKPAGKPTAKGAAKPAPKPSAKPAAKAGARPTLALPLSTATGATATGALSTGAFSTGAFSTASLTRPLAALPVLGPFFPLAPVPGGPRHGGGGPLGILNGPGVAFPGRDLFHFRLSMLSDGWAGHSLQTATRFKLPISLLGAAVIFFLVQALIDRRDPKFSGAPERPHEDSVGFQ